MNYLVLGASSFSGTWFCDELAEPCVRLSRPKYDLNRSLDAILEAVESARPRYVVNFAALNMVGESWDHYADYYRTNVIGIAALADALSRYDFLEKFVQVSTPEVYGATLSMLSEDAPFRPSTPYAVSRAAADLHLAALHKKCGFPVCFTRSVNVYGPRQQLYRIVPKTVLKVLRGEKLRLDGGGASERSFVHIRDVVRAIRCVAERGVPGRTYHVSGSELLPIRTLVGTICAMLGVKFDDAVEMAPERPGKDPAYWLAAGRIESELRFHLEIPLLEGLEHTVQWFRLHAPRVAGASLEYTHHA